MFSRNLSTHLGHGERTQDPRKCRCGIPESCVLCPCSKLHPNVERVGLCFQRPYLVSQRERTSEKRRQRRVASGRRVLLSGEAEANLQIRRHRVSPIVINARSGSAAAASSLIRSSSTGHRRGMSPVSLCAFVISSTPSSYRRHVPPRSSNAPHF